MKARQIHMSSFAHVFKWGPLIIGAIPGGQRWIGLYLVISSDEGMELGVGIWDSYVLGKQNISFSQM